MGAKGVRANGQFAGLMGVRTNGRSEMHLGRSFFQSHWDVLFNALSRISFFLVFTLLFKIYVKSNVVFTNLAVCMVLNKHDSCQFECVLATVSDCR